MRVDVFYLVCNLDAYISEIDEVEVSKLDLDDRKLGAFIDIKVIFSGSLSLWLWFISVIKIKNPWKQLKNYLSDWLIRTLIELSLRCLFTTAKSSSEYTDYIPSKLSSFW